jgi:hypothetical protein
MPIGTKRTWIIWVGSAPSEYVSEEFERRNLGIRQLSTLDEIRKFLSLSRAIVFCGANAEQAELLLELAADCVNYGLKLYSLSDDEAFQNNLLLRIWEGYGKAVNTPLSLWTKSSAVPGYELAQECLNHDPGPSPDGQISIEPPLATLVAPGSVGVTQLLLSRAFYDCTKLDLYPLGGSFSGAAVFRVFATLKDGQQLRRPLPFYAKIAKKAKIQRELENYRDFVLGAIPFNLRPNPITERCVLPHQSHVFGILVGNFVESSDALWEAAQRGRGTSPTYCLFDNALRGWRLDATIEDKISVQEEFDRSKLNVYPDRVPTETVGHAKSLGLERTPQNLVSSLKRLAAQPHGISVIHGDLHVDNIRARGGDAVLIDFYAVRVGPTAFDAAVLETSLAFRRYGNGCCAECCRQECQKCSSCDEDRSWESTIDALYAPEAFLRPPDAAQQQHQREWLWNSVRQIRMFALSAQASEFEYQAVVAFTLLRRSIHTPSPTYPLSRLAYSLVIADRLIKSLEQQPGLMRGA